MDDIHEGLETADEFATAIAQPIAGHDDLVGEDELMDELEKLQQVGG